MALALDQLLPVPGHSGDPATDNVGSPTTLPSANGAEWDISVKKWEYVAPMQTTGYAKPCGKWVLLTDDATSGVPGGGKEYNFKNGAGIAPRTIDTGVDKQDVQHDMNIESLPEVP